MNFFRSMRLGIRLGAGFALVLMMMLIMAGSALWAMTNIGVLAHRVAEQDLVKADAAVMLNDAVQANGMLIAELFLVSGAAERSVLLGRIEKNKSVVNQSLQTLEQLIYTSKGKAMLADLVVARTAYVATFTRTQALLERG